MPSPAYTQNTKYLARFENRTDIRGAVFKNSVAPVQAQASSGVLRQMPPAVPAHRVLWEHTATPLEKMPGESCSRETGPCRTPRNSPRPTQPWSFRGCERLEATRTGSLQLPHLGRPQSTHRKSMPEGTIFPPRSVSPWIHEDKRIPEPNFYWAAHPMHALNAVRAPGVWLRTRSAPRPGTASTRDPGTAHEDRSYLLGRRCPAPRL